MMLRDFGRFSRRFLKLAAMPMVSCMHCLKIYLFLPKEIKHKQLLNGKTGKFYKGTVNQQYTVVIDAGHQQHPMDDEEPVSPGSSAAKKKAAPGTQGVVTGIAEHVLNLEVALLLRDRLLRDGYSVVMVRETADVQISNIERAMIANKSRADVFVRIHANSNSDGKMCGAVMINPSDSSISNYAYRQNLVLSSTILEEYCKSTGISRRETIEMQELTAANWCHTATALIELGFMSNQEDDLLMASKEFKENAAAGIALGIEKYLASRVGYWQFLFRKWKGLLESGRPTS